MRVIKSVKRIKQNKTKEKRMKSNQSNTRFLFRPTFGNRPKQDNV